MPTHIYTNWNVRSSDSQEQIEPYRKYFFICEGAKTEPSYFKKLIGMRKQLGIHPMIDLRLMEKTGADQNLSYPKQLLKFAEEQKMLESLNFDAEHDKMVIVFDADIFENKVDGYDELISEAHAKNNIVGVTNPGFEVFLILHCSDSYVNHIKGKEAEFFECDERGRLRYPYEVLRGLTGMNSKTNSKIGELACNIQNAIKQEKFINQDVHNVKGNVSSNIGAIIEMIINDDGK